MKGIQFMAKIITLTTDFGTRDPFVGEMKGVLLFLCPKAQIVDLTHEVKPFDILGGAFALASACNSFPKGTIHLAVVNPGVGTQRKAVAVRAGDYFFVGPDNGLLWLATRGRHPSRIVEIKNPNYQLKKVSHTFHGRDVFAPAAAHLANGVSLSCLGPGRKYLERLPLPPLIFCQEGIRGRIIGFDRFGNAVTNIRGQKIVKRGQVKMKGKTFGLVRTYGEVKPGRTLALWGSHGYLEIAVNAGSAKRVLGLDIGQTVLLKEKRT